MVAPCAYKLSLQYMHPFSDVMYVALNIHTGNESKIGTNSNTNWSATVLLGSRQNQKVYQKQGRATGEDQENTLRIAHSRPSAC